MVDDEVLDLPPEVFGRPKAPAGTWASGIHVVNPAEVCLHVEFTLTLADPRCLQGKTVNFVPIDNNESAFSVAVVPFAARNGEMHLVVGTAQDTFLAPRSCTSGFLRTYRFTDDGQNLELLHKV